MTIFFHKSKTKIFQFKTENICSQSCWNFCDYCQTLLCYKYNTKEISLTRTNIVALTFPKPLSNFSSTILLKKLIWSLFAWTSMSGLLFSLWDHQWQRQSKASHYQNPSLALCCPFSFHLALKLVTGHVHTSSVHHFPCTQTKHFLKSTTLICHLPGIQEGWGGLTSFSEI